MVWTGGRQGDLAPAIEAMFDQADALWPDRSALSDGTIGDLAHASRTSDHNPKDPNPPGWVDAGDLTYDPGNGVDHFVLAENMRLRRDRRVKYVIFFGRTFKSYVDSAGRPAWQWQPYTGINAHKQHMHVSVTPEGRDDTSPWFSAQPSEEDDMPLTDADVQKVMEGFQRLLKTDDVTDLAIKTKVRQAMSPTGDLPVGTDEIGDVSVAGLEGIRLTYAAVLAVGQAVAKIDGVDDTALLEALQPLIVLAERLAG